jgi:hypothetical protein
MNLSGGAVEMGERTLPASDFNSNQLVQRGLAQEVFVGPPDTADWRPTLPAPNASTRLWLHWGSWLVKSET